MAGIDFNGDFSNITGELHESFQDLEGIDATSVFNAIGDTKDFLTEFLTEKLGYESDKVLESTSTDSSEAQAQENVTKSEEKSEKPVVFEEAEDDSDEADTSGAAVPLMLVEEEDRSEEDKSSFPTMFAVAVVSSVVGGVVVLGYVLNGFFNTSISRQN